MTNENNSEKEKENLFIKGWNDFVPGLKDGFQKFQKTLEEQSHKNVENWERSKGKVNQFFKKIGENWNIQIKKWNEDVEKIQEQNREQWEATTQRIKEDIENWQDKVRQDWKDGVKSWNRGMIKGAFMFLIVMIPILIVLFVVVYILNMLFRFIPTF